jgi:hypothetical protein
MLEIFNNGNRTNGSNATTGNGNASVIHQVIISPAMAKINEAFLSTVKGFTKYKKREIAIPANNEMNLY